MRKKTRRKFFLTDLSDAYGRCAGLAFRRKLGRLRAIAFWRPSSGMLVDIAIGAADIPPLHCALDRTQVPRLIKALERFMREAKP